jgi:hypothetical protein
MHTNADKNIANRFINNLKLSDFPILILVAPENYSYVAARLHVQNPRCGVATYKAHGHRPDGPDNSRPQSDECENGMMDAGSVMNGAA